MENGKKIRQSLHVMLTQAEIDLEMWLAMRKARSNDEVVKLLNRRYGRFYIAAENALFNSLISILYKAFETRDDSVNFKQLLKNVPTNTKPEIKAELDEVQTKIKPIWIKISHVRNKVVGHQSLEQSAREVHALAGVKIHELEQLVKDAQHFLCLVGQHFHDTQLTFNLKGTQSFDNLLDDLRTHNSCKPK